MLQLWNAHTSLWNVFKPDTNRSCFAVSNLLCSPTACSRLPMMFVSSSDSSSIKSINPHLRHCVCQAWKRHWAEALVKLEPRLENRRRKNEKEQSKELRHECWSGLCLVGFSILLCLRVSGSTEAKLFCLKWESNRRLLRETSDVHKDIRQPLQSHHLYGIPGYLVNTVKWTHINGFPFPDLTWDKYHYQNKSFLLRAALRMVLDEVRSLALHRSKDWDFWIGQMRSENTQPCSLLGIVLSCSSPSGWQEA